MIEGGGGGGGVHLYTKELAILIPMHTSHFFLGKPIDVGQSDIVLIVFFVSLVKKCFVRNRRKKVSKGIKGNLIV